MRTDVHSAALRAAMKVAFSVAFVSGCSSPASPGEGEAADSTEAETSESEISTGKKKPGSSTKSDRLATGCHKDKDASTPKASCKEVVDAAFPTEGDYPGVAQDVSAAVRACCTELLLASHGMMNHRWDCCANAAIDLDGPQNIGSACTPWGPPVPPAMRTRTSGPKVPPDAWLEVA